MKDQLFLQKMNEYDRDLYHLQSKKRDVKFLRSMFGEVDMEFFLYELNRTHLIRMTRAEFFSYWCCDSYPIRFYTGLKNLYPDIYKAIPMDVILTVGPSTAAEICEALMELLDIYD